MMDKRPDTEGTVQRLVVIHDDDEGSVNLEHLVDQLPHNTGRITEEISVQGSQRRSSALAEAWEALADSTHQVLDEHTQVTVTLLLSMDVVVATRRSASGSLSEVPAMS